MGGLPAIVRRELRAKGVIETFLADRVAQALAEYGSAPPSNEIFADPLAKKQNQILDELCRALAELRALQACRRLQLKKGRQTE